MKEKKKVIIAVVVIAIIIAIAVILVVNSQGDAQRINEANTQEEEGISKLISLKEKLEETQNYTISLTLNDDNKRITTRKDEKAKIEILDEGQKTTYIVKDKTTYLLSDKTKKYYEYQNTMSLLNDFLNNIDDIVSRNYTIGTEEIEGKEYRYEEFEKTSSFIINYKSQIDNLSTKTRVYFDGNDLKYIKTYIGDVEQLLKVDIKLNNSDDSNFNIPDDYEDRG